MTLARLYVRALALLGPESRRAWLLGFAGIALAAAQLADPDSLWWLWLSFFREHLVSLVSIVVLLPLALYLNWRLALILIALCIIFTALTALVLRKAEGLQGTVESHYSDLAERTSDAVG